MTRLHGDTLAADGLLDFAVNVWPLQRPERLRRALRRSLDGHGYPDDRAARTAIAQRHDRSPEEVLALNGACDALWLAPQVLRPRRAACVEPCFTEARAALESVGARVTSVPRRRDDWSFDPGAVPADAELVYVGNPNNPTGSLDDPARVLQLLRPQRCVVVDESFMDFVAARGVSLAGVRRRGLVVLRSVTKLWGLAGIRAGYLVGDSALVARLASARQPWPVNAVALAALAVCATDAESPAGVVRHVAAARATLVARLRDLEGVQAWDSAANFVLLRVAGGQRVARRLRDAGIAVRPAGDFATLDDDFLRVAVRSPEDNARLVAALAEALASC